jgi:tetratricopeptide (TPR) repeat protein
VPTVNESGTAANGNRISIRLGEILQATGYLLIVLAILDFITGNFLGKDFTGSAWSPYLLGVGGSILKWIGNQVKPDSSVAYNALQNYDEAIRLDPQDAKSYYDRGYAYRGLGGQNEQAERDFAKAKELGYEGS